MLPVQAADFLKAHNVTGRMFNTYENGGYLVWRLWPTQTRFHRSARPQRRGLRGLQPHPLLRRFQRRQERRRTAGQIWNPGARARWLRPLHGQIHTLAAALADPRQTEWKLVQADNRSMVFMRQPPPGVQPLNNLQALQSIENQCQQQIEHDPDSPPAPRGIGDFYTLHRAKARAAQWMAYYDSRSH